MGQFFDGAAESYDSSFTNTFTGRGQRNLVWKRLDKIIKNHPNKTLKILEINCGTGEDAIHLAGLGHDVLATDISPKMVEIAQAKITQSSNAKLRFQVLNIQDIDQISEQFDLVFSNFGGLNCLSPSQFSKMGKNVANLLNVQGLFVAVIMSRDCAWEQLYFLFKRMPEQRKRRLKEDPLSVMVNGIEVPTWFYSPKECTELLQNHLKRQKMLPIGIGYPPSYLNSKFEKNVLLRGFAMFVERMFQNSSALSNRADHFLLTFSKK